MAKKFQVHPTDDPVLNILVNVDGVVGDYAKVFPGEHRLDANPKWLEDWFIKRSRFYSEEGNNEQEEAIDLEKLLSDIISRQVTVVKRPATILSIWPHYFRGFRDIDRPINLSGKLVVVDGRNSSGKTSLAEAFEWLLSGQLVRRSLIDMGDSKELENCIGNQLRPEEEQTWVESEFIISNGEHLNIKRLLIQDYGDKQSSVAESQLFINGVALDRKEEEQFLDELLAGIPPVLMQHSLRTFVSSTPSQRRDYFERLLRLDELAYLIEKTVVGNARMPEFTSHLGSLAWKNWEELKNLLPATEKRNLRRIEQSPVQQLSTEVENVLGNIARSKFSIPESALTIDEVERSVENIQQQEREKSFPLLENLRPQREIDPQLIAQFSDAYFSQTWIDVQESHKVFKQTKEAREKIGEAQMTIAQALENLTKIGAIKEGVKSQTCPLCDYKDIPTLTVSRIEEIHSWQPVQSSAKVSEDALRDNTNKLWNLVDNLLQTKTSLLPSMPSDNEWENALKEVPESISLNATKCKKSLETSLAETEKFVSLCKSLLSDLSINETQQLDIQSISKQLNELKNTLPIVIDKSHEYMDSFSDLENSVGKKAREDIEYNLREVWLSLIENLENLVTDFVWEQAKKRAQKELEKIRKFLLDTREKLIESRRISFSEGMTAIWRNLRSDRYSTFSRLFIPPASGKGLPLEIEVKALLDDGNQQKEVDALRVFSESQINILGVAAFSTRSKLLGHKFLLLDDPVQSMDEDHFKTFCSQLLPELLKDNDQIIIFTHNDTFARELSFAWNDQPLDFYITMDITHTRKKGCFVNEGNRRVPERLKRAEKYMDEGDLRNGWIAVRQSLERLYTLVRIKHGEPGFDHSSWRNTTVEDMRKQGVDDLIGNMVPEAPKKLGEILGMTAAAAHDKKTYGNTDLANSVTYIRKLLPQLRIGG